MADRFSKRQTAGKCQFVGHFVAIFRFLNGRLSSQLSVGFLVFLCALEEILIYNIGLISASFYYALLLKDVHKFYLRLVFALALILFMSLVKSAKSYVSSVLYIEWREHVSKRLLGCYFDDLNYYFLAQGLEKSSLEEGDENVNLDNVDQRISQDVDQLCSELSQVVAQVALFPLTVLYYSFQVYSTIGLWGLLACIAIFLASTLVNRFFVNSIVKWSYLKGKHEGNYRTELINCMKNSEMIAFANAAQQQKGRTLRVFKRLMSVHENLILSQFFLSLCTAVSNYFGSILPYTIIAVPIFSGSFDQLSKAELSHKISSNAFICLYLINCFSKILDISSNIGQVNGFGYRITELLAVLSAGRNGKQPTAVALPLGDNDDDADRSSPELFLQLTDISAASPSPVTSTSQQQHHAIRHLNFDVRCQENVLITGDSGQGKTAILRIIKGLWPVTSGVIRSRLNLNDNQQVMFLAHSSRLAQFVLQEIVSNSESRQKLIHYTSQYSLEFVLEQGPKHQQISASSWSNLSPGQQQILNFVLVFCLKPRLLFLDDATNSLTDQMAEQLYEECARLAITVVTIASNERLSLTKFHTRFIRLNGQ